MTLYTPNLGRAIENTGDQHALTAWFRAHDATRIVALVGETQAWVAPHSSEGS